MTREAAARRGSETMREKRLLRPYKTYTPPATACFSLKLVDYSLNHLLGTVRDVSRGPSDVYEPICAPNCRCGLFAVACN